MTDIKKFDLQSKNITQEQKSKLRELFPEVFTEDKIDFEKLRLTLGDEVDNGEERFGMVWPGKRDCFKIIQEPSIATLKPYKKESVNWDSTENLFIEGDNLEVLKQLQKSYYGKVKMIYIDPPYNTGNEFIYPDKFSESLDTYLAYSGQVDDQGRKFSTNTEAEGRFHSKWMNMMFPRLFLARNLLRDDGVIFISIDDHEVKNLRSACDEVFGEECFVGQVTVLCNPKGRSQDKHLATCHEYLLVYSRIPLEKGALDVFKSYEEIKTDYPLQNQKGVYRELELRNTHREFGKHNRPNLYYPFYVDEEGFVSLQENKNLSKVLPIWDDGFHGCWTWGKDKSNQNIEDIIAKKINGKWKIYRKRYLSRNLSQKINLTLIGEFELVIELLSLHRRQCQGSR